MKKQTYNQGVNISQEDGEVLNVRLQGTNKIMLDNGEEAQVKRAGSNGTPIAQSQTDSSILAAAPTGYYYVILHIKVMCDAATAVTFNSKPAGSGVAVDGPWPCAANGGYIDHYDPAGLFRCVAEEGLTMTTGAGGNTSYRIKYIEVPLNVDIL